MIPRYSRDDSLVIWSDENKFSLMLQIELYACEAHVHLGNVPISAFEAIKSKAGFDVLRIKHIENEVKHDIIAFLTNLSERIGDEARYIHLGMTSSDVLDTCFSIQLFRSSELIIKNLEDLLVNLKDKAFDNKDLLCIGRTHGISAEPLSFGLKFARFYSEFQRSLDRLRIVSEEIKICKISGAVGNFSNIDPFVEEYVASKLGLRPETISTQVVPRDRHAMFFSVLAVIASSIENVVTEIRHLHRSEVWEVNEYFADGQKGSSAMPHKKNPVLSENLTGIARMIRANLIPVLENVTLWHERDISHSAVERVVAPDVCILLDFALNRLNYIIKNLIINKHRVAKNLDDVKGLFFSQRLMLSLVESGMSREEAYKIVQSSAMKVHSNDNLSFYDVVSENDVIMSQLKNLDDVFDISVYSKYVDVIFDKVFK